MFSFGMGIYKNMLRVLSVHIHMLTPIDYLLLCVCGLFSGMLFYYKNKDYKKAVAVGLLFSYLFLLLEWNVIKRNTFESVRISKPFWSYPAILHGNKYVLYQVLMNCCMLIPVGFILTYIINNAKFQPIMLLGITLSCVQELLQLVFRKGQVEVDDVLHNAIGALSGYLLFKIIAYIKKNIRLFYHPAKESLPGLSGAAGATDKQLINKQSNSLNLFRLLAALNVFYGHAIRHLRVYIKHPALDWISALVPKVPFFFILSGFLIWMSIERSQSFSSYFRKRLFRIYPELWVAVVVELASIIVFYKQPINYPLLGVFGVTQGTAFQFWTPGFLRGYGCGTPNGSLWTICITVQFYIIAWWIHKKLAGKPMIVWARVLIVSIALGLIRPLVSRLLPTVLDKLYSQIIISYLWMFMCGCFLAEWFELAIIILRKYWYILGVLSIICCHGISFDLSLANYALLKSVIPFLAIIGIAYRYPKLNLHYDISYGVYIYHMIIINAMISMGYIGKGWNLIVTLIITIALAFFSTLIVGYLRKCSS